MRDNALKAEPPSAAELRGTYGGGAGCALNNYENHNTISPELSSDFFDPAAIWQKIAFILSATTNPATYELHFAAARPIAADSGALIVALPTPANVAWVRTRLAGVVERAIRAAGCDGLTIDWRVR